MLVKTAGGLLGCGGEALVKTAERFGTHPLRLDARQSCRLFIGRQLVPPTPDLGFIVAPSP